MIDFLPYPWYNVLMKNIESHFQNKHEELFSATPFRKEFWKLSKEITRDTKNKSGDLINKSPNLSSNKEEKKFVKKSPEKPLDKAISSHPSLTKEENADQMIAQALKNVQKTSAEIKELFGPTSFDTFSEDLFA